jgi:HK97 gp10 family phage protein
MVSSVARGGVASKSHAGGDMTFTFDAKEIDRIMKNLQKFDDKIKKKIVRTSVREAGKVFVDGLRTAVPNDSGRGTGLLRRKMTQSVKMKRGFVNSTIGAKWVEGKDNPAIYVHILEHGGSGKYRKTRGTNPFAKRAFDRKRSFAGFKLESELRKAFKEASP